VPGNSTGKKEGKVPQQGRENNPRTHARKGSGPDLIFFAPLRNNKIMRTNLSTVPGNEGKFPPERTSPGGK